MSIMEEIGKVTLNGEEITLFKTQYSVNRRTAIQGIVYENNYAQPFAMLTCNIPEESLEPDEVIVKDWSENKEFAKACLKSGLFEDTMARVRTGYALAPIWKIKNKIGG